MIKKIKEKIISATGSVAGFASILGSWQVCHNVCLGIIAVLAVLGITVVGMPLAFLTKIAVPMWIAAFVLLIITFWLYFTKKCISQRLIMFNSGIIIAGIPISQFSVFFWIVGGSLAATGAGLYIKDKVKK